jgi:hypothetical protein
MAYPLRKKSRKPVGPDGKTTGPIPDDYGKYVREQVALQLEFSEYADDEIEIILSDPKFADALRWYWEDATAVCLWEGTVIYGRLGEAGLAKPGFGEKGEPPFADGPVLND